LSDPLWNAVDAAAATGGRSRRHWRAERVSIDSRDTRSGDLFVAIVGPERDGHDFVERALAEGAAAAVVARQPEGIDDDAPLLLVDDTMAALEALGRAGRKRAGARIVGITGSVGKTGSKEALRRICAAVGPTHASAASHNNHWGVPLSLANLPADAAFGIFEMGMNHAGEIAALTRQVRPHVALVTAIAPAHMAFFADIEAVAAAKAEIFEGLEPDGVAIVPAEAPAADRLCARAEKLGRRVVRFGERADCDVRLLDADLHADDSRVRAVVHGREITFALGIPGRHWVSNALGLLAAGDVLGLPLEGVLEVLGQLRATAGRGARETVALASGGDFVLLDESYNANPRSMEAALEVLERLPGRHLAVLGDMLELGEASADLHAGLADAVRRAKVAHLFACGPLMAHLCRHLTDVACTHADRVEGLLDDLRAALRPGDAVLVKGSLGSRMAVAVDALRTQGGAVTGRGR